MAVTFIVLACTAAVLSIAFAFVLSTILDTIVAGDLESLKQVAIFSSIFSIVFIAIEYGYNLTLLLLVKKVMIRLRSDLFQAIINKSIVDFEERESAAYINELTANCNLFEERYLKNLCSIPYLLVSFGASVVATMMINAYLLLFMIFMAFCMMAITKFTSKPLKDSTAAFTKSTESYTVTIKEELSAFSLIKTSNLLSYVCNIHNDKNKQMEKCKFDNKNKYLLCNSASSFIGIFSTVIIMLVTGYLSIIGVVAIGAILAIGQLMGKIISPITSFAGVVIQIKSANVIGEKFNEILTYKSLGGSGHDIKAFNEKISFKNVGFAYELDKVILKNIDIEFEKGKKYAIVGNSGSGKSTLLKLILGYFKKYSGEIFIDSANINDITLSSLYNHFGIVSQNVFLFNDSIKNNITLFEDCSDIEFTKAIEDAGLIDFIQRQPQAENTLIGENGNALSGGERQRIAIARALIKKYKVLLLDEVTSNLDAQTALAVEETFLSLKDVTVLMITHRLNKNLLENCDMVISLKNGAIAEKGTFRELVDQKGYFYSLFKINN